MYITGGVTMDYLANYCLGAIFIIAPMIYFIYTRHIIANGIETDATVIGAGTIGQRRGMRVLSYTVDGKEYETKLSESAVFTKSGDKVRIYYLKDNPEKIALKGGARVSFDIICALFIILGAIIFLDVIFRLDIFEPVEQVSCGAGGCSVGLWTPPGTPN
jgi:hypothetical protein